MLKNYLTRVGEYARQGRALLEPQEKFMSSFWEWEKRVVAEHDLNKPFAPENGTPLRFKVGDPVIYKNEQGFEFKRTITGYYTPTQPCSSYATGARYMLDWECYWYPAKEDNLYPDSSRNILFYEAKSYCKKLIDYSMLPPTMCCGIDPVVVVEPPVFIVN